jgi:hypothetical protein
MGYENARRLTRRVGGGITPPHVARGPDGSDWTTLDGAIRPGPT